MLLPDRTVWVKSTVEDPVQLDVNWVRTTVSFAYDNDTGVVFYQSGECKAKWLSASGWERDEDYADCHWYYSDNQSKVTVSADEHFTNDDFCRVLLKQYGTDHVYHNNVVVTGNSDGSADGDVDIDIFGPCGNLLTPEIICSWD